METVSTQKTTWNNQYAGKYLTFKLDTEEYGIEILKIREIIGIIPVTKVPRMPEYVKGVINLRGKVIPIIDLRLKFGLAAEDYTKLTCFIVVDVAIGNESMLVGVAVDTVNEVMAFSDENLEPAPSYGGGVKTDFIRAMGKISGKVKILLDIDKILSQSEIASLQETK